MMEYRNWFHELHWPHAADERPPEPVRQPKIA